MLVHAQEDLILETTEEFIVKLDLLDEDRIIGVHLSDDYNSATITIINNNGMLIIILMWLDVVCHCSYSCWINKNGVFYY